MSESTQASGKRINVVLRKETLRLLDAAAPKGTRSRLVDEAIRAYIGGKNRAALRKQLREGAIRRAERDLSIAEEWFPLEEEV